MAALQGCNLGRGGGVHKFFGSRNSDPWGAECGSFVQELTNGIMECWNKERADKSVWLALFGVDGGV